MEREGVMNSGNTIIRLVAYIRSRWSFGSKIEAFKQMKSPLSL